MTDDSAVRVDSTPRIPGIGYHKTGTTTLRACLEQLGYSHVGYRKGPSGARRRLSRGRR